MRPDLMIFSVQLLVRFLNAFFKNERTLSLQITAKAIANDLLCVNTRGCNGN